MVDQEFPWLVATRGQIFAARPDAKFRGDGAVVTLDTRELYRIFRQHAGPPGREFGSREVQALAGVSMNTITSWIQAGMIQPRIDRRKHRKGRPPYRFAEREAFYAAVCGALSRKHVLPQTAKKAIDYLRRQQTAAAVAEAESRAETETEAPATAETRRPLGVMAAAYA